LQSFCALLQELCPLHEFPPIHFVLAACIADPFDGADPESCAIAAEAKNSAATAEARSAPFVPLFIVFLLFALRSIASDTSGQLLGIPRLQTKVTEQLLPGRGGKSGNFSRVRS
jgi:hypothetical protein